MMQYFKNTIENLEAEISEMIYSENDILLSCEKAIDITFSKISELKNYISEKGFKDQQTEIHFFKHIKPQFVAKLIYYNSVYNIVTKKPQGEKPVKKYIKGELEKLKQYFDNNLEFYKYYRTNSNFLDDRIFIRGKYTIKLNLHPFYFDMDHNFSTSHDYKVAEIIANDLIQVYLEDQLHNADKNERTAKTSLKWTGSKVALIELIYALQTQGVFDNGKAEIKEIAKTLESTFNIDLRDFYHTFLELRNRKTNRTKFLDTLRDTLNKRMDEEN